MIDRLAREGKLELEEIKGKWESFSIQILPKPLPGIEKGLFIIGSDKRGTIFGIYELSRQIGVSLVLVGRCPGTKKEKLFM